MKETVGIIGLGRMGMPSAKVLLESGYHVVGYARRPEVIEDFVAMGGEHAPDYKTVAEKADTVIVFVLNDSQVLEVVSSEHGLLAGSRKGSAIICMATINKHNLEDIARQCAERQVDLVDCPCTGGPARIEARTLTMIAAAPTTILDRCRPILECLGNIHHVGETPGMGQAVKHCNQLLVATTMAATMEIITMARKGGLDPRQVCDILHSGIAGSDYFRLISNAVLEGIDSRGGLGQMIKDIGIVVNSGRRLKIPLVVANAANFYFVAAESLGLENVDSGQLIKAVERFSEPDN